MLLYLDASAIVKLAIEERETAALEAAVAACRAAFSSKLSVVECTRAVARVSSRRARTALEEVFEALVLHDVSDAVLRRAGALQPATLRSLDAIHLATALLLGAHELSFVTYDEKLVRAAEDHGLPTLQPG